MKIYSKTFFACLLFSSFAATAITACDKPKAPATATHSDGTAEVADANVANNVQQALIMNDELKPFQLSVKVLKGDAQLTGEVRTQSQLDLATSITKSVAGVHTVHNEIVIK